MKILIQIGLFMDIVGALLISFDMLKLDTQKTIRDWLVANSSYKTSPFFSPKSADDVQRMQSIAYMFFWVLVAFVSFLVLVNGSFNHPIVEYFEFAIHIFFFLILGALLSHYLHFKFMDNISKLFIYALYPFAYSIIALSILLGIFAKVFLLPYKFIEPYFADNQLPRLIGISLLVIGFSLQLYAVSVS